MVISSSDGWMYEGGWWDVGRYRVVIFCGGRRWQSWNSRWWVLCKGGDDICDRGDGVGILVVVVEYLLVNTVNDVGGDEKFTSKFRMVGVISDGDIRLYCRRLRKYWRNFTLAPSYSICSKVVRVKSCRWRWLYIYYWTRRRRSLKSSAVDSWCLSSRNLS